MSRLSKRLALFSMFCSLYCFTGCDAPRHYNSVYYQRVWCEFDRRPAVLTSASEFAHENELSYVAEEHTLGGERFIVELRRGDHFLLLNGFLPTVSYGQAFKEKNRQREMRFDESGALVGTPHQLSISAHSSQPGQLPALKQLARQLHTVIENACRPESPNSD